jgi:hypothetical protein
MFPMKLYIFYHKKGGTTMDFKTNIQNTINTAGPDVDRKELLVDIFKHTVADFFIWYLTNKNNGNRLAIDALINTKRSLISEFRDMSISEIQQSVEWYEELFEDTIKEIFNDASLAHSGKDSYVHGQNFDINATEYKKQANGLYVR